MARARTTTEIDPSRLSPEERPDPNQKFIDIGEREGLRIERTTVENGKTYHWIRTKHGILERVRETQTSRPYTKEERSR